MNRRRRTHAVLTRRRNHLLEQLAESGRTPGFRGSSYVRSEAAALEYAITTLMNAEEIGVPNLGELTDDEKQALRRQLEVPTAAP